MDSLIERLPGRIAKLEALHGSDDPYVKDLKEQLRAMKENLGKSTQDVYLLQARSLAPGSLDGEGPTFSEVERAVQAVNELHHGTGAKSRAE